MLDRHLDWEACWNVRDLGGLPVRPGRIRRGALIRADSLERLTPRGWDALVAHGVRTVIDLRNADERGESDDRPANLTTLHLPLDAIEDREFWDRWEFGPQFATPLYYRPHLERFPERTAAVLAAIAAAPQGGVLVHCQGGRDRTGMIAMVVLALLGAEPEAIAADYALSSERLRPHYRGVDDVEAIEAFFAERGTTATRTIIETLESLDIAARVRAGGLTEHELERLRTRLVEGA